MISRRRSRRTNIVTAYVMAVVILFVGRQLASQVLSPASEPVENGLIFISDSDSIDAGRNSNSVYRIGLDGNGLKRIVGSIPHDGGYLRTTDIDCERASQQLVIASHRRDLNGFHHAMLDGSLLHLDTPKAGEPLTAVREIALAPDGAGVIVSREYGQHSPPLFGLVSGDLLNREFTSIKPPTAEQSYLSPDWAPDGQRISYIIVDRTVDAGATYKLAVAKPDGNDEHILLVSNRLMAEASWSPDGYWLALEMGRQVYKIRTYGSELTRLSNHQAGATSPRWSLDGRSISFVAPSSFPGFNQLIVMDADGGDITQVINIRGEVTNGCWV